MKRKLKKASEHIKITRKKKNISSVVFEILFDLKQICSKHFISLKNTFDILKQKERQ